MKSGESARENAPGHEKRGAKQSENKSNLERNDKNRDRADRGEKSSERNAKNDRDRDRSDRNAKNDHDRNTTNDRDRNRNATNDRDRNRNEARTHERGGASTGASEGTEGRSGGHGSITSVTSEQKGRIRSVFTQHRVEPARNLNVAVNVGVRLPHSVHLYPVPEDVIAIVPAYRDYEYILLDDNRVAIVDPGTFEVVDIIILT
jgi:archaellum component FlaD/FlaE